MHVASKFILQLPKAFALYVLVFLTPAAFAQEISIAGEFGIVEMNEQVIDTSKYLGKSLNFATPLNIGFQRESKRFNHSVFYQLAYMEMTTPRHPNGFHSTSAPYYQHAIHYNLGMHMLKKASRNVSIIPYAGIKIAYLPDNAWDNNAIPEDSSYFGGGSYHQVNNGDTISSYEHIYYDRIISDVLLAIRLGAEIRLFEQGRFNLSFIPQTSFGLVPIYRVDTWYVDHIANKSGYVKSIIKGGWIGLGIRITYRSRFDFRSKTD